MPQTAKIEPFLRLLRQALLFAGVSGVGWLIDFTIFTSLTLNGAHPGLANFASSCAGVSFVYFMSVRRIFLYQGRFLWLKWIVYLAFQATLIGCVSLVITWASARFPLPPYVFKVAVTPFTLAINFLFMKALTSRAFAPRGKSL